MPRTTKKDTSKDSKKKKSKDIIEEEVEEEEDEDLLEEEPVKKSKKNSKVDKKKSKKEAAPEESEDDLSDLDIEDDIAEGNDSGDNDEIISHKSRKNEKERQPIKKIDPETPIGSLKIDEILSFLIQKGDESLNPQLKFGSLNLLKELTGKKRRGQMYGSKSNRNNFNNGNNNTRGFNPRNRGGGSTNGQSGRYNNYSSGNGPKSQLFTSAPGNNDNLYDD